MANTNILIKRSGSTRTPVSLGAGEFAYSYASDTLFLGNAAGNGVINVGGLLYTQTIDAATTANTGSTLVKRDANGKFAGRLTGIADKADVLTNGRNFSISGHDITASAVGFDGSSAVVLDASLNPVPGLTAGTYGSTTSIPSVTVGANGRVLAITTNDVATQLDIAGDSGTDAIDLLVDTLNFTGGDGITSTVTNNQVTFDVDTTVVRGNTAITLQTINGGLAINGNLTVLGTQVTVATQTLNVADPLLYLASNNYTSDIVDIGFAGNYFDGTTQRHTGVFRDAGNKQFYIFDNYDKEPEANDIDVADASFRLATVNANLRSTLATVTTANITQAHITTANVSGNLGIAGDTYSQGFVKTNSVKFNGTTASVDGTSGDLVLTAGSGGLDGVKFAGNAYLLGPNGSRNAQLNYNGTGGLFGIYNAQVYSGAGSSSTTTGALVVTGGAGISQNLNVGGDLNVLSGNTILNNLALSNQLTVPYGGTGQTSFNTGQVIIGSGTNGLQQLANVASINTTIAANYTVNNLQTDVWGRVLNYTTQAISGLTVSQGGTGASSFTTNGITYGNGTGAIQVTAAAGVADQTWSNQVLTTTNAGVPVWTTALDGGTF